MHLLILTITLLSIAFGAPNPDKAVNKTETNITEVPYQLGLEWDGMQYCSGAIIKDTFAITSGSCVAGLTPDQLKIRAGTSFYEKSGAFLNVKRIIVHPRYQSESRDYDIALAEVASPIQIGNHSQPIAIADKEPVPGSAATLSGWGSLWVAGERSKSVQSVQVPIVDAKECAIQYHEYGNVTGRMFCAGLTAKDSCKGDIGSPLVQNGNLIGVMSWGLGCKTDHAKIYTSVANSEIRKFIRDNTGI